MNADKLRQRFHSANPTHLWLWSGLTLSLSPHLVHLPFTLIIFSAVLLTWRMLFELQFIKLPGKFLRMLLTLVALFITFEAYHTLIGRQAGIGLLVTMLCLKLIEMNKGRDVTAVIGLGYFAVVTVFLFNQSIFISLYIVVVATLLTTALVSHNREQSRIAQLQNLKLAGTLLIQATPIMLLLFFLFPRIPGPLWNLPSDSVGGTTGISDTMSPGKVSQLSNNNSVAFRVKFDGEIPPQHELYWRGPVMNHFDGKTWATSGTTDYGLRNEHNDPRNDNNNNRNISYRARGEPVNYTITIEPNNQKWLFALDLIAKLPAEVDLSQDYVATTHKPIQQVKRFRLQSYTNYQLDADNNPNMARYLQLPASPSTQVRQLVREWQTVAAGNTRSFVSQALQYFVKQPFYYTRNPPLLFNNPIDEFLFETRRGFCEHYASSFVYLMRAAGIPARVVTGYQGGEQNPMGDYFIVRQSSAHAWTEVWLENTGWIRIDPTSVIPAERIENPQDLQRIIPDTVRTPPNWAIQAFNKLRYSWDSVNHFWNQWIINYNNKRQLSFLNRIASWFGFEKIDWQGMVIVMISGMTLVFSFFALKIFKQEIKRKDPVVSSYRKFCWKLARLGINRNPAEGATDFAIRASEHAPKLQPAINDITSLYQRLRYAKHPPADGIQQLRTAVRKFRP